MISYKRDVLEAESLRNKDGQRLSVCERVIKKIVEYLKKRPPQRQISSSQCINHQKIQRNWRNLCALGTGRIPLLDARGLRPQTTLVTHRHDSVIDITKWAQEYFQKPLSVNPIRCAMHANLGWNTLHNF